MHRLGTRAPRAPFVGGRAEVVTDPGERERLLSGHRAKYGLQFRIYRWIERLAAGSDGPGDVVLRITDA